MDDGFVHIGDRIRYLLALRGWKQRQLAEAIGHSAPWVSDFLKKPELQSDLIRKVASAVGVDPGVLLIEDDNDFRDAAGHALADPAPRGERHAGIAKSYLLDHVIDHEHPYSVRGLLGFLDAKGPAAGVAKALKYAHLHRSGTPDYKTVELSGVPTGVIPIDLRVPLEVRVAGEITARYPAGMVLLADRERAPADGDLVVAVWDPDPDPTGQDLSRSEGKCELRRFVSGPHGVALLFELGRDKAVTLDAGWRIAATITDFRTPRPA